MNTSAKKMIRVGVNRMVTFRYTMKNSSGEIIANTMDKEPVKFIYGSGKIAPALEEALNGLKVGEKKSFKVSEKTAPGLPGMFQFDIIIDDISWADQPQAGSICGPDCPC